MCFDSKKLVVKSFSISSLPKHCNIIATLYLEDEINLAWMNAQMILVIAVTGSNYNWEMYHAYILQYRNTVEAIHC